MVIFMFPFILSVAIPTRIATTVPTTTATMPRVFTQASDKHSPPCPTLVRLTTIMAHQLFQMAWGMDHTMAISQEAGFLTNCFAPITKSSLSSDELLLGGFGGLEGKYTSVERKRMIAGTQRTSM